MSYSIKPEEHELREARGTVEGTLSVCEAMLEKDEPFEIALGWDSNFSAACWDPYNIILTFNTDGEDWKEKLNGVTAQGYAQSWFLERKQTDFHWEEMLVLGHSLAFAEEVTGFTPEIDEKDEVAEAWEDIRESIDEKVSETSEELSRYGFTVAYLIAAELRKEYEFEEFTGLKKADIVEAGDGVFR